MHARRSALAFLLLWGGACACWAANAGASPIATRGLFCDDPDPITDPVGTAADMVSALDVILSPPVLATIAGPAQAIGTPAAFGVIAPRKGPDFVLLGTGDLSAPPEPGTEICPLGTTGDEVVLTLFLDLPTGPYHLSFEYNFFSADLPELALPLSDKDRFTATVIDEGGMRTIAEATATPPELFTVSAATAGGTGFNLFTADPRLVDNVFGTGLPDAGTTGWQTVSADGVSNGSVTLEFTIAAGGDPFDDIEDGLLDSVVVLDNLQVGPIELVDANEPQFKNGPDVSSNPVDLATGGTTSHGVAADGVSRLLVRAIPATVGAMVDFCLVGGTAPADGGLMLPGQSGRQNCVTATAVSTPQGPRAVAIYQAPDEFNRGGDEALGLREIMIEADFGMTTATIDLSIIRPPVALIHGLWSNAATWAFAMASDPRFTTYSANYRPTNGSFFHVNASVAPKTVQRLLQILRGQRIAVTQVDVVGHSMGGLLSRIWSNNPGFRTDDNFGAGDFHKLITLDTPHSGSPLANLVTTIRDDPQKGPLFTLAMLVAGMPVDQGALDDLSKQSSALLAIGAADANAHALVGTGGFQLVGNLGASAASLPGTAGALFQVLHLFGTLNDLFGGQEHDLIVARDSQEGGLPAAAMTVLGLPDGVHIAVPGSSPGNTAGPSYSTRVIELLNADASGSLFATLPSVSILPKRSRQTLFGIQERLAGTPDLTITSPSGGTVVASGDALTVSVSVAAGVSVDAVLIVGPAVAALDDAPPFDVSLTVPDEAVGEFALSAFGRDPAGPYSNSDPVTLQVQPAAALQSISILPAQPVLLNIGETTALSVAGSYADLVVRDITGSDTGTVYLSSDTNVISVSPEGVLTSLAAGKTTIVAINGSVQDSVTVTSLVSPLIFADGFE